jgi:hypothetical protein
VDNRNLLALLDNPDAPLVPGGNFEREELLVQILRRDNVPDYMQAFLEAHRDGKSLFEGCSPADQLNWLFYDEMTEHPNGFIREWFTFERDLRNVIVGINHRRGLAHLQERGGDPARSLAALIVGRNEVAEMILRSGAPDFGLGAQLPWAEKLFAAARGNAGDFEKAVDTLRFEMLDDLTVLAGFGVESILAAAIRIQLAERWGSLLEDGGRANMSAAVSKLKSGFTIPDEFTRTR